MVHAFGVKPTPTICWDLDLFEYQFSEENIKRLAQHKSVKITFSGPQQLVSVVLFFILKSNLVLFHRFHFVCHPFFEYLFICLSNISLKLFLVVTFNSICVLLFFKLIFSCFNSLTYKLGGGLIINWYLFEWKLTWEESSLLNRCWIEELIT